MRTTWRSADGTETTVSIHERRVTLDHAALGQVRACSSVCYWRVLQHTYTHVGQLLAHLRPHVFTCSLPKGKKAAVLMSRCRTCDNASLSSRCAEERTSSTAMAAAAAAEGLSVSSSSFKPAAQASRRAAEHDKAVNARVYVTVS